MGYRVSTIKNLPKTLGCYYFLVGDYRNRSLVNDLFREDFRVIADGLGENSAIVESTESRNMEYELIFPASFMKLYAPICFVLEPKSRTLVLR